MTRIFTIAIFDVAALGRGEMMLPLKGVDLDPHQEYVHFSRVRKPLYMHNELILLPERSRLCPGLRLSAACVKHLHRPLHQIRFMKWQKQQAEWVFTGCSAFLPDLLPLLKGKSQNYLWEFNFLPAMAATAQYWTLNQQAQALQ